VIIVGAGWAGMAAADRLHRANVDFVVLEATGRRGGRSKASGFGDPSVMSFVVEEGSNWISGCGSAAHENPIYRLANQAGLTKDGSFPNLVRIPGSTQNMTNYEVFNVNGTPGDNNVSPTWREQANLAYECLKKLSRQEGDDIDVRSALNDTCNWKPPHDVAWAVDWALTVDNPGFPARLQSLQAMLPDASYDLFGPDDYFVADQNSRGYARLLDALVQESVPSSDRRVHLNTMINKIEYDCDKVTATDTNGQVFHGRELISTLPLGVLKRIARNQGQTSKASSSAPPGDCSAQAGVCFSPPLPSNLVDILTNDSIVMANLTHIYIQFPTVWWNNSLLRWLSANEGGKDKAGNFTEWHNLNAVINGSNTLMSFVGDPYSSEYESNDADYVKAKVMHRLRAQNPDKTIPDPVAFKVSNWSNNPLTYGAYSGIKKGWSDSFYTTLTQSLKATGCSGGDGSTPTRVRFSGEAMCDEFSGFTQGAYQSGVEVAAAYLHDSYPTVHPNPKCVGALSQCRPAQASQTQCDD
jgi:monoamine oxidase